MPRWYNWGICQQDSASTILLAMKSILSTWDALEQAISILASVMLLSSSTENSDKASNITCAAHRTPPKTLPYFCQIVMGYICLFAESKPIKSKASKALFDIARLVLSPTCGKGLENTPQTYHKKSYSGRKRGNSTNTHSGVAARGAAILGTIPSETLPIQLRINTTHSEVFLLLDLTGYLLRLELYSLYSFYQKLPPSSPCIGRFLVPTYMACKDMFFFCKSFPGSPRWLVILVQWHVFI